ncbi:MAG: lytic transglycosylase domain-containing protein [Spirochaetaceae bacterium]|jgi:soluble lytic murein transglycosylase|nr:lytic transglycosylase domain-containing protein [Spirochaetaceae bacterium]
MKKHIQNIALILSFFFCGALSACASETVLDIPKKDALLSLKKGDISFITGARPARMTEISKIDATAPFYAALLLEEYDKDDERTALLLQEALKSPVTRDAAIKKLSALGQNTAGTRPDAAAPSDTAAANPGNIAAGQSAVGQKDYNEALRKFQLALDDEDEFFLLDKDLLGDLGKAFQYAAAAQKGIPARTGAALFLNWEKEIRTGNRLWVQTETERNERRYLLLFYAARMMRQTAEYGEAETLFTRALSLAPDSEQTDACIWYILDISFAANAGKTEKTNELIKKYMPLMSDKTYFLDFFEKYTHFLCLNQKWDDIAEIFPYIHRYGGPELLAKYAFIMGNAVELKFLTPEKAAAALDLPFLEKSGGKFGGGYAQTQPEDFYQIAYDSDSITGNDISSFYYTASAAKKLGKNPRLKIPVEKGGAAAAKTQKKIQNTGAQADELTKKFLNGFFLFGAGHLAYPYIMENVYTLPIAELRSLAESLAEAERWGESIRLARTYMQRPDYKTSLDDLKTDNLRTADLRICYPFAFSRLVKKYARETGMDEALLYGLIRTESLFIPDIVSRAGAVGLTQLMPETARETAQWLARQGGPDYFTDGSLQLSYPDVNIHLGSIYFQQLKTRMNGDLLALLSYNGGMNRIRRWRNARPALNDALFLESVDYTETREYGRQVLAAAAIYRCLENLNG